MNYRDFFKNHKATAKDIQNLLPEGVDPKEFKVGIDTEKEHTDDEFVAAKIAGDHLKEDPHYYTKLSQAGLEEDEQDLPPHPVEEEHDDFNGGLPKDGGALAIPHLGDPIHMSKIIQIGKDFGKCASGEVSGMTTCGGKEGVTQDKGGVEATAPGDKEPLTAGGKKLDSSIATKSVGGPVTPGDGQKQGGPNSQGTIANTHRMNEHKEKVRKIVKEVLKEIQFDKGKGKWVRIDETKHKTGCACAFCKNKGSFGKKDKKDDKEEVDENTVDMKMGPSYKVVQPNLVQTAEKDWARTNQYDPEITEMYDEEEIAKMDERYTALVTAPKNLTEDELKEMKNIREKLENIEKNFGASQGGVEPNLYDEKKDKWLKKAVDPSHKGFCTPMTKATCTPARKAFAMRAKHGGFEEGGPVSQQEAAPPGFEPGEKHGHVLMKLKKQYGKDSPKTYATAWSIYNKMKEGSTLEEAMVDMKMGPSYKKVSPTQARCADCDQARTIQYDPEMTEVGGQVVQHRSYRTIDDVPQNPEARQSDEVDEGTEKPSKVARTITKGQKGKKSIPKNLKHETPRHTSSGVHKRKTS